MIKKLSVLVMFSLVFGCAFRTAPPAQIVNVTAADTIADNAVKPVNTPTSTSLNHAAPSQTKLVALNASNNNENQAVTTQKPHNAKSRNTASAIVKSKKEDVETTNTTDSANNADWMMPTQGKIIGAYTPAKKGVDIAGSSGQPIYAASSGKVVYSGNGLKGYGNLIIIKHSNNYLSAYAHNKVNLVADGAMVKKGQKIAEMGSGDKGASLHFEVRKNGKPVNPNSVIGD